MAARPAGSWLERACQIIKMELRPECCCSSGRRGSRMAEAAKCRKHSRPLRQALCRVCLGIQGIIPVGSECEANHTARTICIGHSRVLLNCKPHVQAARVQELLQQLAALSVEAGQATDNSDGHLSVGLGAQSRPSSSGLPREPPVDSGASLPL
jgi:hypothetical protein